MNNVIDFINTNRDRYVDELKEYLAIPSISALPEHAPDVKRAAEWSADEMKRIGMQNVRLIETPGFPVVYGDWLGAEGAPTILFYGHYDVQPVDRRPLGRRRSKPPCATADLRRGSPTTRAVFMHFKAIRSAPEAERQTARQHQGHPRRRRGSRVGEPRQLRQGHKTTSRPTSSSSPTRRCSTAAFRRSATACAAWSTSDRRAAKSDLHSGSFGGAVASEHGAGADPGADEGSRRTHQIPGFYDDVRDLKEGTRAVAAAVQRAALSDSARRSCSASGYSTLERVWASRPSR